MLMEAAGLALPPRCWPSRSSTRPRGSGRSALILSTVGPLEPPRAPEPPGIPAGGPSGWERGIHPPGGRTQGSPAGPTCAQARKTGQRTPARRARPHTHKNARRTRPRSNARQSAPAATARASRPSPPIGAA